jgi:hypothetical protein
MRSTKGFVVKDQVEKFCGVGCRLGVLTKRKRVEERRKR